MKDHCTPDMAIRALASHVLGNQPPFFRYVRGSVIEEIERTANDQQTVSMKMHHINIDAEICFGLAATVTFSTTIRDDKVWLRSRVNWPAGPLELHEAMAQLALLREVTEWTAQVQSWIDHDIGSLYIAGAATEPKKETKR